MSSLPSLKRARDETEPQPSHRPGKEQQRIALPPGLSDSVSRSSNGGLPNEEDNTSLTSSSDEEEDQQDEEMADSSTDTSSDSELEAAGTDAIAVLFNSRQPDATSRSSNSNSDPQTLLTRLSTFLPQLAAANSELDAERATGQVSRHRMEISDDEEGAGEGEGPYIEMDLGLGVLEERKPHADVEKESSESSSSEAEDTSRNEVGVGGTDGRETTARQGGKGDVEVMDTLLGRTRRAKRRTGKIQELDEQ
ncbi:hypothetical protein B0A49_02154 [Cryomyces minteri]|uniref:Uncharacterized protein n=1 Tax=Cryomyces minteri TaxID=331657 RepID=A0A4U0XAF7_9PEZI|nr:hypothetical protein B0A49_02154 [Cryomyces minteri]